MTLVKSVFKTGAVVVCAIALFGIGYAFRGIFYPITLPIVERLGSMVGVSEPCTEPLTYKIGALDPRFGLSRERLIDDLAASAGVWNDMAGKKLFEYSENGELTVNLIYDYRQQATTDMKKLGISIDTKAGAYDAIKKRYDSLSALYEKHKVEVESGLNEYNKARSAYETEISDWRDKGGVPKIVIGRLEDERQRLNDLASELNAGQEELANEARSINAAVSLLNQYARDLNLNVKTYNSIGASTGGEFDEGEYIRDDSGTSINVYQFESDGKLRRVLTHELGHALGMGHVEDERAIMYRVNSGTALFPTASDISEFRRACSIES